MERMKRAVCLLLCFVMVVGILPMTAFAAGTGSVSGTGNIAGSFTYTLDTDGVDYGSDNKYLIVGSSGSSNAYALTANGSSTGATSVTISNNQITLDTNAYEWYFATGLTNTGSTTYNTFITQDGETWLYHTANVMYVGNGADAHRGYWRVENRSNGNYRITDQDGSNWRLYYDGSKFNVRTNSDTSVRLFKLTDTTAGAEVKFTVTPGNSTLKTGEKEALTGTVTVDGETVSLNNCTITWASSDTTKATVSNGTVTGVADGSANITATLSAVNGTALQENIVLTIPVTVQSKEIVAKELQGNDPVTTKLNVEPDFSNIKLKVTYDDGTIGYITTANGLTITGHDITNIGYSYATIYYGEENLGTVRVTVEGNPYEGKEDATVYPEYPADGAVRIDKNATEIDFQNTGVVQVELDVAGVSVRNAVDAVLTIDISNSMAWTTGTTDDNFEANKLHEVMAAVKTFAEILLADNDDGTPTNNTITIVTFAGYDAENSPNSGTYIDSVRTLVTKTNNLDVISAIAEGTVFTGRDGDYTIQVAYIPDGEDQNDVSNVITEDGANRGDTNYDYAFWQTNKAIVDGNLGGENREVHVLFMTDGCASNYNGTYYRTSNAGYYYKPGTTTAYSASTTYTNGTNWTNYINDTLIANNNGNTYANTLYQNIDGLYAVGFDMANGAFSGIGTWSSNTDWEAVFNNIVSKSVTDENGNGLIPVTAASDSATLKEFYESLGRALRYAGTSANVSDIVDSNFDLQLTQTTGTEGATTHGDIGFKPTIEIKTYDLWTKEETSDTTLIGTRKGTSQTIETVTFNEAGTEAYSSLIENYGKNIMSTASDGTVTIDAFYFTYTKTPESVETFSWRIGNITDKEIALSYYAYLNGTMEGTRPEGLYYTNEEATLEYIDINEKHATKVFPIPAVAWGGASTAYEFYLVNEQGQPCDRNGTVIPFANRIIITGPYYEELYLNQEDEEKAKEIIAAYVLPAGYTLYDETAKYTVVTASGTKNGSLTISDPADGKVQTTIVVSATEPSYIQSRVAFGVIYNKIPVEASVELTPDRVVIDYGKEIVVDIANGNEDLEATYTAKLVGFSKYYADVNLKHKFSSTSAVDNYKATYGTFSIVNNGEGGTESTVRYTPTAIVNDVEMIFCVIEMHSEEKNDTYYMVDWLTVIPATSVYYETDFADGVFATSTTATAETDIWQQVSDTSAEDDDDNEQDDGTIGVGQTYGYDSTYNDDTHLSDGDSWFVKGQGYDTANNNAAKTYTTFSFKGTGFDLISRTGAQQGLIKVEVFSDAAMTKSEKTVSVLNKSESDLELYQIPVVSINDLTYGVHYVRVSVDASYTYTGSLAGFDSLNRGDEFYFDAIRVFDPAQGDAVAEAAYIEDGESNRKLEEVRALLLDAETYATITDTTTGMLFVDRDQENVVVGTYSSIGPNNEAYLSNGQAIAFKVTVTAAPASFDIGAKSITGASTTMKVTVSPDTTLATKFEFEQSIASSTAQNYNLLSGATNAGQVFANKEAYVVIQNTGEGVLSITDIKAAYGNSVSAASEVMLMSVEEEADPLAVSYTVDASTFALARSVMLTAETPEEEIPEETEPEVTEPETTEPEETEPETTEPETEVTEPETEPEATEPEVSEPVLDIIKVSANTKGGLFNRKTTFTVVTTQDVASLKVAQMYWFVSYSSATYQDLDNGTRVWTVQMPTIALGAYTITAYGADGTRGDSASVMSWGL